MSAAAVIPAPLAYIKVVAVKTLVVEINLVFHHSLPLKAALTSVFACLVAVVHIKPMFRHF